MKELNLVILLGIFLPNLVWSQTENKSSKANAYIAKYRHLAVQEQKRSGVPASITLAQGIHETNAGASELAVFANNHFGIKCKKEWTGETYTYTDDRPDECFRKYTTDKESYKDHSDYLKNSKRYEALFRLDPTDYKGWAHGLKRCGYATNPRYAPILIKTIEDYNLQQYTLVALGKTSMPTDIATSETKLTTSPPKEVVPTMDAPSPQAKDTLPKTTSTQKKMIVTDGDYKFIMIKNSEKPAYGQTVIVNGLKAFYAPKDAGLLKEAINYNIRYARLLELNDLPDEPLEADMFIYLEKKNAKGGGLYHVVKPGETLLQIAQYEGVVLRNLRQINKLKDNEEPVSGTLLHLQDLIDQKPDVIVKKKENKQDAFVGYEATPVPQGQSRMHSGYISKKEIEASSNKERTTSQKQEPITPKEEVVEASTTATTIATPPPTPIEPPKAEVVKETPRPIPPKVEAKATAKEETKTIVDTVAKALPPATDDEIIVKKAPEVVEEVKTVETTATTSIAAPPLAVKEPVVEKSVAETPSKEVTLKKETTAPITEATSEIAVATPILADTTTPPPPVEEQVKEEKQAPPPIEEPKDEYDRLKQRLDKAVYASNKTAKTKSATSTTSTPIPPTPPATTTATNEPVYYTVQKGDNAFGIAKKHNITMGQLKEWNKLDFSEIKVGQKLRVK